MGVENVSAATAALAAPAVVGYCFRGNEGESYLYFVLRDEGLFMTCGHEIQHEIRFP